MQNLKPVRSSKEEFDHIIGNGFIDPFVRSRLRIVFSNFDMAKSQMKGHLSERTAELRQAKQEIQKLKQGKEGKGYKEAKELKKALELKEEGELSDTMDLDEEREGASDDNLIRLFNGGAALFNKQADKVKELKAQVQRERDEHERSKRRASMKLAESENEKLVCRETVRKVEGRLTALTTDFSDAEADLKRHLAESKRKLKVTNDELVAFKRLPPPGGKASPIGDMELASSVNAAKATNADLTVKLHKVEQHCEGYRQVTEEQQKVIERLTKENKKLLSQVGKQVISPNF